MRTIDALVPITVGEQAGVPWAVGLTVSLPVTLAKMLRGNDHGAVGVDEVEHLRLRRAFTDAPPASTRLPFSYRIVPEWVRSLAASVIGRIKRRSMKRWAAFPRWPLDLSADFLADIAGVHSSFARGPTPVILTHDLDSPEGLRNLHVRFLDLEESVEARSTNYIVPCAWPIDHTLLGEVAARGNEIGIHGYDHSNLTPFLGQEGRRRRLRAAQSLIERYGAFGYRAPSLLRTRALIADLKAFYRYDSSIPTSGGLFPTPNNGCASARPFFVEGLLEIPVTMPRDGSLLFLGCRPHEILSLWIQCANRIADSGGIVVLLTHCEDRFSGNPVMFATYRAFLEHVATTPRFAFSTTAEVLARHASAVPVRAGAAPQH